MTAMSEVLDTYIEALGLKALPRTGWVRSGVSSPESVAAHSWGVAWLVLALLPPELDRGRALAYAVLHDLAEVRTGDLTPQDGLSRAQKLAGERQALAAMLGPMGRGPALQAEWEAYEAQADPEARFVRQLDRLDMALQAVAYHDDVHDMTEFLDSAAEIVDHPRLLPLMQALRQKLNPPAGGRRREP